MTIFKLIKLFTQKYGRSPGPNELYKLQQKAKNISEQNKVLQFPPGGKDRINPFEPRPEGIKSLDEFKASEDVYEQSMKPKGEVKTKFEKELGIKLYGDETYGELMEIKNTGKHPRDKADGGRIGFKVGGILDLLKLIKGKYGKKAITTADKIKRPQSALDREMFDAANKRFNKKIKERTSAEVGIDDFFDKDGVLNKDAVLRDITKSIEKTKKSKIVKTKTPDKALEKALDEVGGNFTGDLKYDADVLASELAFQRGLIKEGGDLSDIVDQDIVSKIYNEAYGSVSGQFLKNREIKKMQQFSKPTKTLEGIKDTGTIDISDPKVAEEFSRFMKESDPKSYNDLQQKVDLMNFDPKGRKKNADGGLAHMLGEPRSEYSGGGAGMPPVTHDDNVDDIGPGHKSGSVFNTPQIDPRIFNQNRGSGIMIHPRALGNMQPQTQGLAHGGRTGFKEGGMNRRGFLKLAAGLASLPIIGKYFKAAKVASKIKVLGNTTTTMPAWFPDLVDKFMIKGIGKKIDADLTEYTVKELPGVKLAKHDNGRVRVEGKNAYGESYEIDYTPPGHELIDETTGKAVKTKGEFVANDTRYRQVGPEMDDVDVDYDIVNNIEDIVGGDSTKLEGFAKGTNKTKTTRGQKAVDEAEARSSYYQQERADFNQGPEIDPTDWAKEDPDFATGGLARLLGE